LASPSSGSSRGRASFKMLIIGETGAGKTRATRMIASALASVAPGRVVIVDFAPDYKGVGRPLGHVEGARIIRPRGIRAPRLMGSSCEEAWRLADHNAAITTRVLEGLAREAAPILVINDLTIHVHRGSPQLLYEAIESSVIFVGNAYYGERLRDPCGIWERERAFVEDLSGRVDLVWRL